MRSETRADGRMCMANFCGEFVVRWCGAADWEDAVCISNEAGSRFVGDGGG